MLKHILAGQQPLSTAVSRLQQHPQNGNETAGGKGARSCKMNEFSLERNHGRNISVTSTSSHRHVSSNDLFHSEHQFHHANHSKALELQQDLNTVGRHIRSSSIEFYDNLSQSAVHDFEPVAIHQLNYYQNQMTSKNDLDHNDHRLNQSHLNVSNLPHRPNTSHQPRRLNASFSSISKQLVSSASPELHANVQLIESGKKLGVLHTSVAGDKIFDRCKTNGGSGISRMSMRTLHQDASPSPASRMIASEHMTSPSLDYTQPPACAATTVTVCPNILPLDVSWSSKLQKNTVLTGVKEMLTSLGLLCLVSLLLALLSLTFLLRISPIAILPGSLISSEEYASVYEVTLVLCTLALSLNLCCLLVCAIQFLFAVKLTKSSHHAYRSNKYLQKSYVSRMCAVGGFFTSIPVFLTGVILYTFIQFQSTFAIVTSAFIGIGIVFCGCAMVHNVFIWQKEKTNAMKAYAQDQYEAATQMHKQQHHTPGRRNQLPNQRQEQFHSCDFNSNQYNCSSHQQQNFHSHPRSTAYSMINSRRRNQQVATLSALIAPVGPHVHGNCNLSSSTHPRSMHSQSSIRPVTPAASSGKRSPMSRENSVAVKISRTQRLNRNTTRSVSPGIPSATLDLSSMANADKSLHELSTLV